jgi:hypothetical protein
VPSAKAVVRRRSDPPALGSRRLRVSPTAAELAVAISIEEYPNVLLNSLAAASAPEGRTALNETSCGVQ